MPPRAARTPLSPIMQFHRRGPSLKNRHLAPIFRFLISGCAVLCLVIVGVACAGTQQSTPTSSGMKSPRSSGVENSLRISLPLPGTVITSTQVAVHGEGSASENTMLVAIQAEGRTLAEEIISAEAEVGQAVSFTITLNIAPVDAELDAQVVLYTTSTKDGSVDQRASVPVKFVPSDSMTGMELQAKRVVGTEVAAPVIRLLPDEGKAGTRVEIVGEGFPASSDVEIRLAGPNTAATERPYASTSAHVSGEIKVAFSLPETWPNGDPILRSSLSVVASAPDFVEKAAASFTYESAFIFSTSEATLSPQKP